MGPISDYSDNSRPCCSSPCTRQPVQQGKGGNYPPNDITHHMLAFPPPSPSRTSLLLTLGRSWPLLRKKQPIKAILYGLRISVRFLCSPVMLHCSAILRCFTVIFCCSTVMSRFYTKMFHCSIVNYSLFYCNVLLFYTKWPAVLL